MSTPDGIIKIRELSDNGAQSVQVVEQTYVYRFTKSKEGEPEAMPSLVWLNQFIALLAKNHQVDIDFIECLNLLNEVCTRAATYGFESINHVISPEHRAPYLNADGLRKAIAKVEEFERRKLLNIRLGMRVVKELQAFDLSKNLTLAPPENDHAEQWIGGSDPVNFAKTKRLIGIINQVVGGNIYSWNLFNLYSEVNKKVKSGEIPMDGQGNLTNRTLIIAFLYIYRFPVPSNPASLAINEIIEYIRAVYSRAKLRVKKGIAEIPEGTLIPIEDVRADYGMPILSSPDILVGGAAEEQ